jgi:hypothetical protein
MLLLSKLVFAGLFGHVQGDKKLPTGLEKQTMADENRRLWVINIRFPATPADR